MRNSLSGSVESTKDSEAAPLSALSADGQTGKPVSKVADNPGKIALVHEGWAIDKRASQAATSLDAGAAAQAKIKNLVELLYKHKVDEADIFSDQDRPGIPQDTKYVAANVGSINMAKQLQHNLDIQSGAIESDQVKQAAKEEQNYKPANTSKVNALLAGIESDTKQLAEQCANSSIDSKQSAVVAKFLPIQQKQLDDYLTNNKVDCKRLLDHSKNSDLSLTSAQDMVTCANELYRSLAVTQDLIYLRQLVGSSNLSGIRDINCVDLAIAPEPLMAKTTMEANWQLSCAQAAINTPFWRADLNPVRTCRGEGMLDAVMFCNPIGLGFIAAEESGIRKERNQAIAEIFQAREKVESAKNKILEYYVLDTITPGKAPIYTNDWQKKPINYAGTKVVLLDKMQALMQGSDKRNFKSLDAVFQQFDELCKKDRDE